MKKFKKIASLFLSCLLVFSVILPINTVETEAATNSTIADINKNNVTYAAAKWAVDNGFMSLSAGNKFNPTNFVPEWQMLQVIAKLDTNYHLPLDQNTFYAYYDELNIPLNGVKNTLSRNAKITRGHFARVYGAMNGLDLTGAQAVQYLYLTEITNGTTGKRTFEDYKPNKEITRGDMAIFLYRMSKQTNFAVVGIPIQATGKDNSKITLPNNFIESKDTTTVIPTRPGTNTNDKENRPDVYKAVESIKVKSEELIANGVDSTLITIKLKDSYGNAISTDESLAFKVTSSAGATFSDTNESTSKQSTVIYTDGPELNVFVTAPALTKSLVDTIRFEMVNPSDKYYTYKNRVIEASVRYVPKAEVRVSYEVYDPEQTEWAGGDVDPGVKPLPALPQGVVSGGATISYTPNGLITVSDYDEDMKLLTGEKWETYTNPTSGQLTQGNVESDEIQYGNAELKMEGQVVSIWLFEKILEYMIYGLENEPSSWGGLGSAKIMYTINSDGRATYDLQGVMSEEHTAQFESTLHAAIIYLVNLLPKADDITLAHEESVLAIKSLYDRLSQMDKNILQKSFSQVIGKLEGAMSKIDVLLVGKELAQRPEGMDRYTKIIVNLVAPSGVVITDYRGTVRISYNGKSKVVAFDTNTKDYNEGTGYAGSAVAFFDDVLYGKSKATVEIVDQDPRYKNVLLSVYNKEFNKEIFANPRYEGEACAIAAEVAFVVDHSGSMKKHDPKNYTSSKVKQTIKHLQLEDNTVYRFNNNAKFEVEGKSTFVSGVPSLLAYNGRDSAATNIVSSVETAISNYSSNAATPKALVLVTDGKTTRKDVEKILGTKNNQVKIYVVAVGANDDKDEQWLRALAESTKGAFFSATTAFDLHGPLQAIINSMCNVPYVDNSCLVGDSLFTNAQVRIESTRVTLTADINTGCSNIVGVRVVFKSPGGLKQYDLISRGNNRFQHRPYKYEFPAFDLYTDVDFQAIDKNGQVIGYVTKDI